MAASSAAWSKRVLAAALELAWRITAATGDFCVCPTMATGQRWAGSGSAHRGRSAIDFLRNRGAALCGAATVGSGPRRVDGGNRGAADEVDARRLDRSGGGVILFALHGVVAGFRRVDISGDLANRVVRGETNARGRRCLRW